jgi:hypothetical protein
VPLQNREDTEISAIVKTYFLVAAGVVGLGVVATFLGKL